MTSGMLANYIAWTIEGPIHFQTTRTIHNLHDLVIDSLFLTYFLFSPSNRIFNFLSTNKMQNENGENVDLYVPRKCSWTNRLLTAKDHGSVQINVANIDPVTGLATGESSAFALSGYLRFRSEGDMALGELAKSNDAKLASE